MASYGPIKEHKDVRLTFTVPHGFYLALGEEQMKRQTQDIQLAARAIVLDYLTGTLPKAVGDRPGVVSV